MAAFQPQFEWSPADVFLCTRLKMQIETGACFFYSRPPVRITNSDCREKAERGKFAGKGGIEK